MHADRSGTPESFRLVAASVRLAFGGLLLIAVVGRGSSAAEPPAKTEAPASAESLAFFEKKIRPLLIDHCYECHNAGGGKTKGGLSLDARDAVLRGGDQGPAVVPGEPDKSLLIRAVRYADDDLQMPPGKKLSAAEIADLETWVKLGLPDPRAPVTRSTADGAGARPKYGMSLEEGRQFWSFQPILDPPPPAVRDAAWARTSIDRFVLARLESRGVVPAPSADKRTLLRRVTFDLTGLPPTPAEIAGFLADDSEQAFEKVVDRLLDSPRYGERWGRHWLDVVRYADTSGNASDYPVPQAHRYRDWVIGAFNRDLPYDQFLREQIAGDLMPSDDAVTRSARLTATGYLAIARRFGGSRAGEHHLTLEDTIDNVGRALLGVSLSCARCHDHKFDPFTMGDYYGLYGIFESTRYPFPGAEAAKTPEDFVPLVSAAEIEAILKPHREQLAAFDAQLKALEAADAEAKKLADGPDKKAAVDAAAKALADARKKRLDIVAAAPTYPTAYAVAEAKPANTRMQLRGDPKRLGDEAPRRFPTILGGQTLPADCKTSGRLQLAEWLTDPANPLVARVMVNRIWLGHFGQGLVGTPNDFGRQGKPPTDPALLDHLASRFQEDGWSIKRMHKRILLSRTWSLASGDDRPETARNRELDPANELFGRFVRRRLDAESIRDSLLFVCGALDETPGEAHPFPPAASWKYTQHNPFFASYDTRRRSVYMMQQRLRKNPYLALFDGADPSSSTGSRTPSTTPLQALFMMNGSLVHGEAARFAQRILDSASDRPARLAQAFELAWSRPPRPEELQECGEFLDGYAARLATLKTPVDQTERTAWTALARTILSANEFVFVD